MVFTELGIVTNMSAVQLENAQSPILSTESGIVTDLSEVQLLNA